MYVKLVMVINVGDESDGHYLACFVQPGVLPPRTRSSLKKITRLGSAGSNLQVLETMNGEAVRLAPLPGYPNNAGREVEVIIGVMNKEPFDARAVVSPQARI
jgi:hypothetical protein